MYGHQIVVRLLAVSCPVDPVGSAAVRQVVVHYESSLSLLDAADRGRVRYFVDPAVKHEVVLLVHWELLPLPLAGEAGTIHAHVQVVLDRPELVAILRPRHRPLVKVHRRNALPGVPVSVAPVDLVFETRFVGLVADLALVPIDRPEDAGARQASVADLVIVATRVNF